MAVLNVKEENRLWAISKLKEKSVEIGRLPKKSDFDELTRTRIKSFLGPWPRALEAAGLKTPKIRKISKTKNGQGENKQ